MGDPPDIPPASFVRVVEDLVADIGKSDLVSVIRDTEIAAIIMKRMSARDAKNGFGNFVDLAPPNRSPSRNMAGPP